MAVEFYSTELSCMSIAIISHHDSSIIIVSQITGFPGLMVCRCSCLVSHLYIVHVGDV